MAQAVDAAIAALGWCEAGAAMSRIHPACDINRCRYEGIIDMDSDIVYWNGNNY